MGFNSLQLEKNMETHVEMDATVMGYETWKWMKMDDVRFLPLVVHTRIIVNFGYLTASQMFN